MLRYLILFSLLATPAFADVKSKQQNRAITLGVVEECITNPPCTRDGWVGTAPGIVVQPADAPGGPYWGHLELYKENR